MSIIRSMDNGRDTKGLAETDSVERLFTLRGQSFCTKYTEEITFRPLIDDVYSSR